MSACRTGRDSLCGVGMHRPSYDRVSAGTERMLVDFGKANLIDKARQQPDKVRHGAGQGAHRRTAADGGGGAQQARPAAAAGLLQRRGGAEVGAGCEAFAVGDRVASNGKHAEMVSVPVNLCAGFRTPVSDEAAAFTVIGAIACRASGWCSRRWARRWWSPGWG
jgi:hypothetical protein